MPASSFKECEGSLKVASFKQNTLQSSSCQIPIGLPALVVTIGGYLALAGGIITTVAQTAAEGE